MSQIRQVVTLVKMPDDPKVPAQRIEALVSIDDNDDIIYLAKIAFVDLPGVTCEIPYRAESEEAAFNKLPELMQKAGQRVKAEIEKRKSRVLVSGMTRESMDEIARKCGYEVGKNGHG